MEIKRIMGVGLNIWGCREQFNGLRSTGRHLNLFWKNVTTKSRWPRWWHKVVARLGVDGGRWRVDFGFGHQEVEDVVVALRMWWCMN